MDGEGVTNYSVDKPSYAFSGATTEFDDALIQRGIVTKEQALAAKGMSMEEAQRLVNQHQTASAEASKWQDESNPKRHDSEDDASSEDEDDSFLDDNDDDEFLAEYRKKRVAELQQEHAQATAKAHYRYGEPVIIDRTEWTRHVNDDSQHVWVVVCLTSSDTERTGCLEAAVRELATVYTTTKFVLIAAHSAIPNWPVENLPSLFLYRHGKMQHELLRLPVDMNSEQLEEVLKKLSVC